MYSRFLLLIACVLTCSVYGQKFATSPFSSYGLGEFGTFDNANFIGLGNANVAVIDSLNVNYYNPSSYSFLANGQPLFSTGVSFKNSVYTENNTKSSSNLVGINHFTFAVPFAKYFGLAFGLKPFSRVGYNIYDYESHGSDTVKYTYFGTGSINDAFGGFSAKILKLKNHQVALGGNLSYIFGSTENQRRSNLTTESSGGLELLRYQVHSLYYNLGFTYQMKLSKTQSFTLAGSYNSKQNLIASKDLDLYYMSNVTNINTITDTLTHFTQDASITMPSMYDIGFAYNFRPKVDSSYNKAKIYQLNLYGSYQIQNWSEYTANFSNDSSVALMNTSRISFGVEFIPHMNYLDRTKSIGYFNRIRYRAGFQYGTLALQRNNSQLVNKGISAGVSLPILTQRSVSSLNFGVSYGTRGNNENSSLNERYLGVNFGITLAPGTNDKWFRKYKID